MKIYFLTFLSIIIHCGFAYPQSIYTFSPTQKIQHRDYNYFDEKSSPNDLASFIRTDSILTVSVQGYGSVMFFEYNDNGKMSMYVILSNTGTGRDSSIKHTFTYDQNNSLNTETDLGWSSNGWDSLSRISYYYSGGKLTEYIFQDYQSGWRNVSRSTYEYNDSGYLKTDLSQLWVNNKWENKWLTTRFYSNSPLRDSLLFESWNNSQWLKDKKTIFYYGSNGIDVDSMVVTSWTGTLWVNLFKRIVTNDENHNQIEQIDQFWDNTYWVNDIHLYYSYNASHYVLTGNSWLWQNNQWVPGDSPLMVQNPDGLTIAFITNFLYGYYSDIVGVNDVTAILVERLFLSENYPNPFNPSTAFRYHIPLSGNVEIKIFDILGREIAVLVNEIKAPGDYEVEWNASEFTSGIYFYQIKAESFVDTKKMILLK